MRIRNPVLWALLSTAVVVTAALCWFGWRLWTQERAVARERQRERLESAAETLAASVRSTWAQAGESLSRWISSQAPAPPTVPGAVVFTAAGTSIAVSPAGALPYVPWTPGEAVSADVFALAEAAEFGGGGSRRAAEINRSFTAHADPRIRGEALLRLGRVLLKAGDRAGAQRAYTQLARLDGTPVAGLPAELVGLDGLRKAGLAGSMERMAEGLRRGRWLLAKGPSEYYREVAAQPASQEGRNLSEAMAALWAQRGGPVIDAGGRLLLGLSRHHDQRWAGLVAEPAAFLDLKAPAGIQYQLADARGRVIAGVAGRPGPGVTQVLGEAGNPWVLRVWREGEAGEGSTASPALVALMIVLLWGAVYFMARALRREAAVARLQSDFVAAVSHEFRSPLTTVRQLSEMLEMGQVPNEERRQKYYGMLAAEAQRLQRLVEGLLQFGRMEAGERKYRTERLAVGELVRRAAEQVEPGGRRIAIANGVEVRVKGDIEALAAAVRNLLDNALKYSPPESSVDVAWWRGERRVFIAVRDQGPGIPEDERKAVFEKFVRGRQALEASIRGTGVGLAMVKHILEAHGGEVRLESKLGQGSTFMLVLPEGD